MEQTHLSMPERGDMLVTANKGGGTEGKTMGYCIFRKLGSWEGHALSVSVINLVENSLWVGEAT